MNLVFRFCAAAALCASSVLAVPTVDPFYAGSYSIFSLGTPTGVPGPLGGLTLKAGDNGHLLIGGSANTTAADILDIAIDRDAQGHVTGFNGSASFFADANGPGGGIDGGLAYGPGGVLFYTTYSDGRLGQIKPGSSGPDKLINLGTAGYTGSTGTG